MKYKDILKRVRGIRTFYRLPQIIAILMVFVYFIFLGLSFFDYIEPYIYPLSFIRGKAMDFSGTIIFGPYPHQKELEVLKEKYGVEIVLSLMNTQLPHEKALYESEKKKVESLSMKSTSFSLQYLDLNSEVNQNTLKSIISYMHENATKKVYIHCYLGRHRVGFVKKALENEGFAISADNKDYFKKLLFFSDQVIFGPYPYANELKSLKQKYGVKTILSLLDVRVTQERLLYEKEKKYAETNGLRLISFPLVYRSYKSALEDETNKETVRKLVAFLKENTAEKVFIHCYLGQHRVNIVEKALLSEGFVPSDRGTGEN